MGAWWVVDGWWTAARPLPEMAEYRQKMNPPPVCFLFHTSPQEPTNSLRPAYQVYCCTYFCTAVILMYVLLTAVLLYVVEVLSVGGCRVHCVVRGGWVGRSVRGSVFEFCGRLTLFFCFYNTGLPLGAWEYHRPHCWTPLSFTTVRTAALPYCCPVLSFFFCKTYRG